MSKIKHMGSDETYLVDGGDSVQIVINRSNQPITIDIDKRKISSLKAEAVIGSSSSEVVLKIGRFRSEVVSEIKDLSSSLVSELQATVKLAKSIYGKGVRGKKWLATFSFGLVVGFVCFYLFGLFLQANQDYYVDSSSKQPEAESTVSAEEWKPN